MRTSLNEIKELEDWLFKKGNPSNQLVTEARVLTNSELQEKADWQSQSYDLIRDYGQQKLLSEIQLIEQQLFTLKRYRSFQDRIRSIFKH